MITINGYSGEWQSALRPSPPRVRSTVRIHENADARELDDFKRCLTRHGLRLSSAELRYFPRLKMDVYRIERGKSLD